VKTLARPADVAELIGRLAAVRPDSPRRWGRMSAHQMVCHLSDAYRMAVGEKDVERIRSLIYETVGKWVALYVPLRWPAGIRTTPENDQEVGGTRPAEFARDVAELVVLVGRVAGQPEKLHGCPHPILGRMSEAEWMRWGYLHMDHHLRQFGA
jgi:hypothetical protein